MKWSCHEFINHLREKQYTCPNRFFFERHQSTSKFLGKFKHLFYMRKFSEYLAIAQTKRNPLERIIEEVCHLHIGIFWLLVIQKSTTQLILSFLNQASHLFITKPNWWVTRKTAEEEPQAYIPLCQTYFTHLLENTANIP